jgi:predicted ATPase
MIIVLEDLHWGDLPSITYLGDGLRALSSRPLMILALARPEVNETFPGLWSAAHKSEIALSRLAPRAAERLVRAALGPAVAADVVARIVERADGNAFYLEELIRRVSEGGGDTLPETVLALVQSRLARLEPEARRIVRAASVFGDAFWRGGVAEMTSPSSVPDLDSLLPSLVQREILTVAAEARFAGEKEYS